jgi:Flp pilus assembly protein TadG
MAMDSIDHEEVRGARPPRRGRGLGALLRRFHRGRSGVAAIEFAMLAFPFFLIVFAILETAFVFIGEIAMDQAVARAGRFVRTGQIVSASLDEIGLRNKICAEVHYLLRCEDIAIDLRSYASFNAIPTAAPISGGTLERGSFGFESVNPGQIMALRAFYEWPLYSSIFQIFLSDLSGGKHLLMSVAAFKTEPFSGTP